MTTTTDELRLLVRDDDENVFSDEALQAAIDASGDNVLRAAGIAFQGLAAEYAQIGRSTKTDDLAIDTRGRGADLLKVAQSFFAEAAAADEASASGFVQIVGLTPRECDTRWPVRPEGSPWPVIC